MPELARAYVAILADTSLFRPTIDSAVGAVGDVIIGLRADPTQFDAQLRSALGSVDTNVILGVRADTAVAKAELDALDNTRTTILDVLADDGAAKGELNSLARPISVPVSPIIDTTAATAALRSLTNPISVPVIPVVDQSAALDAGSQSGGQVKSGLLGALSGAGPQIVTAAGLFAIGKEIISVGGDFQAGLAIIQATTKATGLEMAAVSQRAKDLGNDLKLPGISAKDAVDAITTLTRGNFDLQEAIDASRGALQLSVITGQDAKTATQQLVNILAPFRLGAKDAAFVVNELAGAEAAGVGKAADYAEATKFVAGQFNALQSPTVGARNAITELNTALVVLDNDGGLRGSLAGTTLNDVLTDMTGRSDKAKAAIAELTDNFVKQGGVVEKGGTIFFDAAGKAYPFWQQIDNLRMATEGMTEAQKRELLQQFTTEQGYRGFTILLQSTAEERAKYTDKITDNTNADRLAAAASAGLKGAMDNLVGSLENAAISTAQAISPVLVPALTGIADAVPHVVSGIGDLIDGIADIATSTASGGKLTAFFSGFTSGFGSIDSLLASLRPAFADVGLLFANLKDALADLVGGFTGAATGGSKMVALGAALRDDFIPVLTRIGEVVRTALGTLGDAFTGTVTVIRTIWRNFGDFITSVVVDVFGGISAFIDGVLRQIQGVFEIFSGIFTGKWSKVWQGLKDVVGGALDQTVAVFGTLGNLILDVIVGLGPKLLDAGRNIVRSMGDGIQAAFPAVLSFFQGLPARILAAVGDLTNILAGAAGALIGGLGRAITGAWPSVLSFFTGLPGRILAGVGDLTNVLAGAAGALMNGMAHTLTSSFGAIGSFLTSIPGRIRAGVGDLTNVLAGAGGALIGGFYNTVVSTFDKVLSFFTGLQLKLGNIGAAIGGAIGNGIKTAINVVIVLVDKLIDFINNLQFTLPKVHIKGTNVDIGGQTIGLGPNIPTIKPLAAGGTAFGGGSHLVGEEGPELFVPERDGYVMTHADTARLLASLESGPRGADGAFGAGGVSHTAAVNISVPDPAWAEIIAQRVVRTQAAAFGRVRT